MTLYQEGSTTSSRKHRRGALFRPWPCGLAEKGKKMYRAFMIVLMLAIVFSSSVVAGGHAEEKGQVTIFFQVKHPAEGIELFLYRYMNSETNETLQSTAMGLQGNPVNLNCEGLEGLAQLEPDEIVARARRSAKNKVVAMMFLHCVQQKLFLGSIGVSRTLERVRHIKVETEESEPPPPDDGEVRLTAIQKP